MLSILSHLKSIFSTIYGYVLSLLTLFWNFIHPEIYAFSIVGLAVLMDLIWGIIVAHKQGKFILSEAARETFKKVSIYGCALFMIFSIERGLHDDWFIATKIACSIAAGCELWSISALMLIVKPDMPFLRLFRL
ncbi:MAG: hypothetical protein LBO74_02130 [Candidatus Symbiothrix sp.]|jgi:hypothetical protein|nr:hypothetical protein [Candidatus Symbiothrix sp.]